VKDPEFEGNLWQNLTTLRRKRKTGGKFHGAEKPYCQAAVEARMRLTRKITTTNKIVIPIKPGMPTSSAKPVLGSAWVVVGPKVAVNLASEAWVNKAETVAVLGSIWSICAAGVLVV
jgi:hypothetical protein